MTVTPYSTLKKNALALTSYYETSTTSPATFGVTAGNFDGQGLSHGAIQFNLGKGTLQPIWKDLINNYPSVVHGAIPNQADYDYFVNLILTGTQASQVQFGVNITDPANAHKVVEPWNTYFSNLGQTQESIDRQIQAAEWYYGVAEGWKTEFNLWTRRGYALLFDIAVQSGGISQTVKDLINADFAAIVTTGKTREAIESEKLVIVANRRADDVGSAFQASYRERKLAIANGSGDVYGGTLHMDTTVYDMILEPAFESDVAAVAPPVTLYTPTTGTLGTAQVTIIDVHDSTLSKTEDWGTTEAVDFNGQSMSSIKLSGTGNILKVSNIIKADPTKAYEVELWAKADNVNSGSLWFFGAYAYDTEAGGTAVAFEGGYDSAAGTLTNLNSTSNLYFARSQPKANSEWRRYVAYILPATAKLADLTGLGVNVTQMIKLLGSQKYFAMRFLDYYNGTLTTNTWLTGIRVREVDYQSLVDMSDAKKRIKSAESSIIQNAGNIQLKVSRNDLYSTDTVNLLHNTEFRVNTDYWTLSSLALIDKTLTYGGAKSIKIEQTGALADAYCTVYGEKIPVTEGQVLTASIYTRSDNIAGIDSNGVRLVPAFIDAAGATFGDDFHLATPTTNNEWQRFSSTMTVPTGAVYMQVRFHLARNGKVWFSSPMLNLGGTALAYEVNADDIAKNLVAKINLTPDEIKLEAKKINLLGAVTIDSLDTATQTKVNDGATAKSTVDTNKVTWDRALNINADGKFDAAKLNGTLADSQLASALKWNNAESTLNSWKSGTTLINGGMIATNTIIANQIAIGDFANLATVNENFANTMVSVFGGTKVLSGYIAPTADTQDNTMVSDYIPNPFIVNDEIYFEFEGYVSAAATVSFNVFCYNASKGWLSTTTFNVAMTTTNTKYTGSLKLTNTQFATAAYVVLGFGTLNKGFRAKKVKVFRKNKGTLLVDGSIVASHIQSLNGLNAANGNFIIDANGNVTLKGTLNGATGSFTGDLTTKKLIVDTDDTAQTMLLFRHTTSEMSNKIASFEGELNICRAGLNNTLGQITKVNIMAVTAEFDGDVSIPTGKLTVPDGINQETMKVATLAGAWVNYGGSYRQAAYWKDKNGVVHLTGLIKTGAAGSTIFTLPAGYRPWETEIFLASHGTAGSTTRIDIKADGTVVHNGTYATFLSLSGISFRAEN